ncbi:MAG TPA: cupredoxin domain-containing protein [Anaerolineae bacterium]
MKKLAFYFLILAGVVLAACAAPAAPAVLEPIDLVLTTTDIAYDPDRFEVTAGQLVRLTLRNEGVLVHDFSIMNIPHTGEVVVSEDAEEMEGHDMSNMAEEPEIHVAAPAGGRNTVEFTPSQPGEYEFYCTVSGHKEAGMVGTFVVKAP